MTDLLFVLVFAIAFIGFGFLARGAESRGCAGCRSGECDNGAEKT